MFAVDVIIVLIISLLAGIAYSWCLQDVIPETATQTYTAVGVLAFTNVSAVLAARGDYRVSNLVRFYHQARDLVLIWTGVFFLLLGVGFSLKVGESLSRGAVLTFFALGLGGMIVWRGLLARFLEHALSTGAFAPRNVILIGEQSRLPASGTILEMRRCGYAPIQTFEIGREEFVTTEISPRLRATIDGAIELARTELVTEILLRIGWENGQTIERITKMLAVLPIPIYLLPDENVARYLGRNALYVGTTWAAEIQRAPLTRTEQFVKRCFDLVGAASVLLLLSPVMLLTALLIKLDSQGPILFFQTRNGFNGRAFRIVKFRSMHVLEDGNAIRQATRGDPRVTRLGRWLRRTNIDELPQLFNVLYGDMSLVGPRPHAAGSQHRIREAHRRLCFSKPCQTRNHGLGTGKRLSGRNTDHRPDVKTRRTRSMVHFQLEHVVGYRDLVPHTDPGPSANRLLNSSDLVLSSLRNGQQKLDLLLGRYVWVGPKIG